MATSGGKPSVLEIAEVSSPRAGGIFRCQVRGFDRPFGSMLVVQETSEATLSLVLLRGMAVETLRYSHDCLKHIK